jgi:hypothetical protein
MGFPNVIRGPFPSLEKTPKRRVFKEHGPCSIRCDEVEELFHRYCVAAERAQSSQKIEDGIAAGKAWAAFLHVFDGGAA